ncbi:Hypothetical_protein [Hexamita inflata]|uniref:Hypothetical_protein n=1 Tax=Hexamita inflata TaxID=28002 RepID=A0AA86NYS1_9EUKA|nr:Hypothetical protein HINF_LOCUS14891 [Hexamita inflata]
MNSKVLITDRKVDLICYFIQNQQKQRRRHPVNQQTGLCTDLRTCQGEDVFQALTLRQSLTSTHACIPVFAFDVWYKLVQFSNLFTCRTDIFYFHSRRVKIISPAQYHYGKISQVDQVPSLTNRTQYK